MEFSWTDFFVHSAITLAGIITFLLLVCKAINDEPNNDDHDHHDSFGQEG